jgi:hypothetical protein
MPSQMTVSSMTRSVDPPTFESDDALRRSVEPPELWLVRLFGALVLHLLLLAGVRSAWVQVSVPKGGEGGTIEFVEVGTVESAAAIDPSPKAEGVAPLQNLKPGQIAADPDQTTIVAKPTNALPSPSPSAVEPTPLPVEPSPTPQPTVQASTKPTVQASTKPTVQASTKPTVQASTKPTVQASTKPTVQASTKPTVQASTKPTVQASTEPIVRPPTVPPVTTVPIVTKVLPARQAAVTTGKQEQTSVAPADYLASELLVQPVKPILLPAEFAWPIGQTFVVPVVLVFDNPQRREKFTTQLAPQNIAAVDVKSLSIKPEQQLQLDNLVRELLVDSAVSVMLDSNKPDGYEPDASTWKIEVRVVVQSSTSQ